MADTASATGAGIEIARRLRMPSPFGSDTQAKLDARRRQQEERRRYQPVKTRGPKAPITEEEDDETAEQTEGRDTDT